MTTSDADTAERAANAAALYLNAFVALVAVGALAVLVVSLPSCTLASVPAALRAAGVI